MVLLLVSGVIANKRLHLTKPIVTPLADARAAPIDFAGEANVRWAKVVEKMIWFGPR